MRRRTFLTLGNEGIKASEAVAGDVCLYNKTTQKLLIITSDELTKSSHPLSNYTPIGVVVIPGSHDVYGTGECAIMSLRIMNTDTPDVGSTDSAFCYLGGYFDGYDTPLPNYETVYYNGIDGVVYGNIKGYSSSSFLPSDKFTNKNNPLDKDTYYIFNEEGYYYSPSPYNDDDTRCDLYYKKEYEYNCLCDFDGKGNTNKLVTISKQHPGWSQNGSVLNSRDSKFFPLACCCWRYHTEGTNQGDWYLPAIG